MGATKRGPNRSGNSTKAADIAPFVILSEAKNPYSCDRRSKRDASRSLR